MKNRHTFCSRSSMRTTPWLDQLQGIDTPAVGPTCPSVIQATTANGQEGRDPATFEICGTQTTRNTVGTEVSFAEVTTRYATFLVIFPRSRQRQCTCHATSRGTNLRQVGRIDSRWSTPNSTRSAIRDETGGTSFPRALF